MRNINDSHMYLLILEKFPEKRLEIYELTVGNHEWIMNNIDILRFNLDKILNKFPEKEAEILQLNSDTLHVYSCKSYYTNNTMSLQSSIVLKSKSDKAFSAFNECSKYGVTLNNIPHVADQNGMTCGIYAVFNATNYHWSSSSGSCKTAPFPARKRDSKKKSEYSLRQFAKEHGDTIAGEMFTAKGMSYLIDKNGCTSMISQPDSYEKFLEEIEAGLAQNCPVIIPYSTDLDSNGNPQAYHAHWATAIGSYAIPKSKTHYLLLAHYGEYGKVDAKKLYKGFAQIEDTYPKHFLFKKRKGKGWKQSMTDNFGEVAKSIQVDEIDLNEDYKRRLITVKSPFV